MSMAEASAKQKNRTFRITFRCSDGRFIKFFNEFVNTFTKDEKPKSRKKYVKEKKRNRKGVSTHKSEVYVKTEVDKNVCRDIFCKTHVDKRIFTSSSADNLPRPPLFQPHNRRYYHTVYPPPPLFQPHNRRSYHTVYPPPPSPPLFQPHNRRSYHMVYPPPPSPPLFLPHNRRSYHTVYPPPPLLDDYGYRPIYRVGW
uniref:Uncharacterized protein n=1 Tax=Lactuca sativa TaxID=4236 RepID=A0A9R1VUE1_LACSA|nr:hypothetical protein LSAT_V11C400215050 [Lactuca sativa]